tara:strand:- start:81 stop:4037 length:3957 start_codon:yes stop_codon:yes gene_type:complete
MYLSSGVDEKGVYNAPIPYSINKFNTAAQFVESVKSGFRNNFLGQGIEASQRALANQNDDRDPLTQEEFAEKLKPLDFLTLEYDPNEKPDATDLRIKAAIRDYVSADMVDPDAGLISFQTLGALAGGVVDPVSFIPFFGQAGKTAQLAKQATQAGRTMSAGFNTMKSFTKTTVAANAVFELPYAGLVNYNNRNEYTLVDFLVNVPVSSAFGVATFGVGSSAIAMRKAARVNKVSKNSKIVSSFIENNDYEAAVNQAYVGDALGKKLVNRFKLLKKHIKDPDRQVDDATIAEALDYLRLYEAQAKRIELDKIMANNFITKLKKGAKVKDVKVESKLQLKRLQDVFKSGKTKDLTEEDLSILEQAGVVIADSVDEARQADPEKQIVLKDHGYVTQQDVDPTIENIGNKMDEIEGQENIGEVPEVEYVPQKVKDSTDFNTRAARLDTLQKDPTRFFNEVLTELFGESGLATQILNKPDEMDTQTFRNVLLEAFKARGLDDTLGNRVDEIVKILDDVQRQVDDANTILFDPDNYKNSELDFENLTRVLFIARDPLLSPTKKIELTQKHFEIQKNAAILRQLNDETIISELISRIPQQLSVRQKIGLIQNYLDGSKSSSKFAKSNRSVDVAVRAQSHKDLVPVLEVLDEFGLRTLFLADDSRAWSQAFKDPKLGAAYRAYGANLKEASNKFVKDVIDAMNGRTPEAWKGVKGFDELSRVLRQTQRNQLTDLNLLGIPIIESKAYMGLSQKWSREVILRMSEDDFVAKMLRVVDPEETARLHGNIMKGDGGALIDFEIKTFLKAMYKEIKNNKYADVDDANVFSLSAKSRKIKIKEGHEIQTIMDFSGFDSLGRLLIDQIRNRSEQIALAKTMGTNPLKNFELLKNRLGVNEASAKDGRASLQYKTLNATEKYLAGELDNPVDAQLGGIFKTFRKISNLAFLPGSGLSTLTDIPMIAGTMRYLGDDVNTHFNDYWQIYREAVSRRFQGNSDAMSSWYTSQAAGFDVITRTIASRVAIGESGGQGMIDKLNNLMFQLNGLTKFTTIHQDIYVNLLSSHLARELPKGAKMSPVLLRALEDFGFTKAEIVKMSRSAEKTSDGVKRIGPTSIEDPNLSFKLREFFVTYMKQGVLEPDAGSQAMSRGLFQAGTPMGETARVALQYSSYPLAMSRLMYERFLNTYTGNHPFAARRTSEFMATAGSLMAMGYFITVLKDLSRFKEPINILDMTALDTARILKQSSILGMGDYLLDVSNFGLTEVTSPLAGTAIDFTGDVLTLDVQGAGETLKPFTGANYPFVGPLSQQILGMTMGESAVDISANELDYISE